MLSFHEPALARAPEFVTTQLTVTVDHPPKDFGMMENHSVGREHGDQFGKSEVMQRSWRSIAHV